MKILYLSAVCSQNRFDRLVAEKILHKMPQGQKYHHLLLEGLRSVSKDDITVLSSYPINESKRVLFPQETETEDGIKYIYPGFVNLPFFRQFFLWWNAIRIIFKNTDRKTIIVCSVLSRSLFSAARLVRFFKRNKILGIVTDVPGHTSGARRKLLPKWKQVIRKSAVGLSKGAVKRCDAYLLLTEAMNDIVNPKGKPNIVIEGHADITMKDRENNLADKNARKTIMYAGGTHKEFGIALLVDAFLNLNNPEWELHIYGDGNYQNELKRLSAENEHIKYYGLKPNAEVVEAQLKAWLMVNPRITDAEYVKYSFPSKTLECMVSGTPLLTTRLAGMPKDYYPYVYLFDEETEEGFRKVLSEVFSKSAEELHAKGAAAKVFAIDEKNNVKQAAKLYSFIEGLV